MPPPALGQGMRGRKACDQSPGARVTCWEPKQRWDSGRSWNYTKDQPSCWRRRLRQRRWRAPAPPWLPPPRLLPSLSLVEPSPKPAGLGSWTPEPAEVGISPIQRRAREVGGTEGDQARTCTGCAKRSSPLFPLEMASAAGLTSPLLDRKRNLVPGPTEAPFLLGLCLQSLAMLMDRIFWGVWSLTWFPICYGLNCALPLEFLH